MNQRGSGRSKANDSEDTAPSLLDDAFNERTVVRRSPALQTKKNAMPDGANISLKTTPNRTQNTAEVFKLKIDETTGVHELSEISEKKHRTKKTAPAFYFIAGVVLLAFVGLIYRGNNSNVIPNPVKEVRNSATFDSVQAVESGPKIQIQSGPQSHLPIQNSAPNPAPNSAPRVESALQLFDQSFVRTQSLIR